jgi:hypothetical protein
MASKTTKKAPGLNGFKYRERHGVIVLCRDAREQQAVFNKLQALGYTLKVVTV